MMVSDRKIETLKEALEKKRGDLEQEVLLLFLKDFRLGLFLSKLGTKKDKSNAEGDGTAHCGSQCCPKMRFLHRRLMPNPLVLVSR